MEKKVIFTLKEYKERYNEILESFICEYEDYEEIDFINEEIEKYKIYLKNTKLVDHGTYTDNYKPFVLLEGWDIVDEIINKIEIDTLDHKGNKHGVRYDALLCRKLDISFTKIISFLENKKPQQIQNDTPTNYNGLKWLGSQTDFMELIKALIQNENLKGRQKVIIQTLSNVFNIEIKNPNKLMNDIKIRNEGSETLFLNKLKKTLFDYITLEKKK